MDNLKNYLDANRQRFLDELLEILRIPSISALSKHKKDVKRMAEATASHLRAVGLDKVKIYKTAGHPVVYGEKIVDAKLPTILVYGHYDVQPSDPDHLWTSPAFEPVIKTTPIHPEGAIFARGSCDDKGQFFMHVKAFEMMQKNGALPCNVKFMIEGEEEIGSQHLEIFCRENAKMLACDVVLISDTSIIANDTPSISVGLRGLCYMEVEVTGPNRDLHSGVYGGTVPNPCNILCDMISSLHDENRHITIPGFYDDVQEVSLAERAEMAKAPFDEAVYCRDLQIANTIGEKGYSSTERTSIRPTLDVNGIWGGFTGEGAKTVLPLKPTPKFLCALSPIKIHTKLRRFLNNILNQLLLRA